MDGWMGRRVGEVKRSSSRLYGPLKPMSGEWRWEPTSLRVCRVPQKKPSPLRHWPCGLVHRSKRDLKPPRPHHHVHLRLGWSKNMASPKKGK